MNAILPRSLRRLMERTSQTVTQASSDTMIIRKVVFLTESAQAPINTTPSTNCHGASGRATRK